MKFITEVGNKKNFSIYTKARLDEKEEKLSIIKQKDFWKKAASGKYRVQMVGLGDVGQNVAIGLTLLGGEYLESIGLYDLNPAQVQRMQIELSQFSAPLDDNLPEIIKVTEEDLFDCEIFLFCATKAVPAIGSKTADVRMAQYEANRKIVSLYAKMASERKFEGMFLVISDPVDLLCMEVLRHGQYLHPEQIRGCGLGVMNARARYYAKKDPLLSDYLVEGRAFGPHGKDLVIANSVKKEHYDEELSRKLTQLTVQANMEVRDLGYKPFLAPAMSSAVFTILALIKGEWNYSAAYLNGLYFGALNRRNGEKTEWEQIELPEELGKRIEKAYQSLEEILWG